VLDSQNKACDGGGVGLERQAGDRIPVRPGSLFF